MKIEALLDTPAILAGYAAPVHLVIRFAAPTRSDSQRTRPIAFTAVIDRSGSMAGRPLAAACEATKIAVKHLRSGDSFGLVTFDDQARTVVPLHVVSDKQAILQQIDGITDGGSTNLTAGWMLGRDELLKSDPKTPRRLLLLSDGQLNVGIVEPPMVRKIVSSGLEKSAIRTSSLGLGVGYDEQLLADLASATGGAFYDANSPEKLPGIFAAELEGLQSLVIQNLRLRIKKLDFCDRLALFADYPVLNLPDGRIEIAVGDLVSEEERTLVLGMETLAIPLMGDGRPAASLEGEPLLGLEVVYDEITADGIASKTWTQILRVLAVQDPAELKTNGEVIPWVAQQRAAQAVEEALRHTKDGRNAEAIAHLQKEMITLTRLDPDQAVPQARRLLTDLLERLEQGELSVESSKSTLYSARSHRRMSSHQHWVGDEPAPDFIKPSRKPKKSDPSEGPR